MSKETTKIEMTLEDQKNINTFSNLNSRMHDIENQIAVKKKILEEVDDAGNELMLSDEDSVRYVVGECFVHMDKEDVETRLQGTTDVLQSEVATLNADLVTVKEEMQRLKAVLYGKFGKSINLEE